MRYQLVTALLLSVLLLNSDCLIDFGNNDAPAKKTLLLTLGRTKLIQNEQEHFQITSSPEPESSECLVWQFTGPDTVICIVQTAGPQNDIEQISFTAGDWSLKAAIYDSTEYETFGDKASDHGAIEVQITAREITVDLVYQSGGTLYDYLFQAVSPEKDCLHDNTDYLWDFGDGTSTIATDSDITAHHYDVSGFYQVIVSIACTLYENDEKKYTIASDTLDVAVNLNIAGLLELELSPSDTLWNTYSSVTFKVELNLNRNDYPAEVLWAIDFGDGESLEFNGYLYDRYISHRYMNTGSHHLYVAIYDLSTGILLADDSAMVKISNLPFLQQINKVTAYVNGYITKHYGIYDPDSTWIETSEENNFLRFGSFSDDLTWNEFEFTSESTNNTETQTAVSCLSGTFSRDGPILIKLEYTKDLIYTDNYGNTITRYERIVLENTPLTANYIYGYYNFDIGSEIGQYVTEFECWNRTDYADGTTGYDFYDEFDWLNTSLGTPYLSIKFTRE